MYKFRKRVVSLGLALVLCTTLTLPVMARGSMCPTCKGTNTEPLSEVTTSEHNTELCIHGHANAKDYVDYRVHYSRIYCNTCRTEKIKGETYREEMSRICQWQ